MRPRTSPIWNISKLDLENVVKNSTSLAEVLRHFKFASLSGNYITLKARLKEDNINFSNIQLGIYSNSGRKKLTPNNQIPIEDVLVENSTYSRNSLKRRLLKDGLLKNQCYICGQIPEWNGKPLSLQIDHINGINND